MESGTRLVCCKGADKKMNEKQKVDAWRLLKKYSVCLSRQQVRTIAGQIKSGNPQAAVIGLMRSINAEN